MEEFPFNFMLQLPMEVIAAQSLEKQGYILARAWVELEAPCQIDGIKQSHSVYKKAIEVKIQSIGELYRLLDDIRDTARKYEPK